MSEQHDDKNSELDEIVVSDAPVDQDSGPEWVCIGCGALNNCHTIRYENPSIGVEYDLECNDCGSTEFEEGYHSAMLRVIGQREKLWEKLEAMRSATPQPLPLEVTTSMFEAYRGAIKNYIEGVPEEERAKRWKQDERGWRIPETEKCVARWRAMVRATEGGKADG